MQQGAVFIKHLGAFIFLHVKHASEYLEWLGEKQTKKEIHYWEVAEVTFLELAAYPKRCITKGK